MMTLSNWKGALLGATLVGASWAGFGDFGAQRGLTPEQARLLDLFSIEMLDDGLGNPRRTVRLTGANLQLVNGTGTTDGAPNGVGNLLVGYDAVPLVGTRERTGSHLVVVGDCNEYTRFGGVVVGRDAFATGDWSSMIGGTQGGATGHGSVVIGHSVYADGEKSVAVGGSGGRAIGLRSVVVGGSVPEAFGQSSVAIGGNSINAIGKQSVVVSGVLNSAIGDNSVVTGGFGNDALGFRSAVSGGAVGVAPGTDDWVAGELFEDN